MPQRQPNLTRAQVLVLYLVLTAAIATGLALFSSASTGLSLLRTATSGLFLPVLLALIVASLLEPVVRHIESDSISRTTAIFIVFSVVSLLLVLFFVSIAPHWREMWNSLLTDLPRYLTQGTDALKRVQLWLIDQFPFMESYNLAGRGRAWSTGVVEKIVTGTTQSALRIGGLVLLVPLFSFFFLRDGQRIARGILHLTPNRHFEMIVDLYYHVSRQMAHFIRGRLLEAAIIAVVVTIGLSLTEIRYAPFLGIFAGVTNLVPYLGPLVGMIPGLLIALVDLGLGGEFWWIVIVYFLIAQVIVDNFILIPVLISHAADIHPLWVIVAIIVGGQLYGVMGMIIGVPVASVIKLAILEIRTYQRNSPWRAISLSLQRTEKI